jgi:formimidoylglutamate deiminase
MTPAHAWLPDYIYFEGRFESGVALLADGSGRITGFSSEPEVLETASRMPRRAILPGLVNVHSHSFQRAIRARTEHRTGSQRDTFWTWREAMYHAANALSPEDIYDCARMAFLEMLAGGITAAGEFHYLHHVPGGALYDNPNLLAEQVVRAARETGLRIALLRTAYARAGFRRDPNPGQSRFITGSAADFIAHTEALRVSVARGVPDTAWVGIAPHSVRAVPLPYLLETVEYARGCGMKVHMHVSEQPAEIEACEAEYGMRPIELLHKAGVLAPDFTAIHAIHINPREIEYLAAAGARIGACPTTERNLGDGIGPGEDWTTAGVATCFGSDSNIQIDLLEEAREFEYHLRLKRLERAVLADGVDSGSLARSLFANATEVGAASIGSPGGALQSGRPADFFTVDLDDVSVAGADRDSLMSHIVFSAQRTAIREVFVAGKQVICEGRHWLQEEIVARFAALQARLWGAGG